MSVEDASSGRATFPAQLDVDVTLRDGSTVHIRPAVPEDWEALRRFLAGLSTQSRIFRFFTEIKDLDSVARRLVEVDYHDRHGLVAWRGGEIVGHGFYALERPGRAEVALTVADALQGMGLGTILLGHLAAAATDAGIAVFEAEVMPENHRMLGVFRDSGFPVSVTSSYGVIKVEFPTSLSEEALERFERREQLSAIAALRWFLEPRSIAVVGASRHRGTIGGEVFHNLLESGFPGPVYPVSPHPVVQSVAAYPDLGRVPGPVDLAVVVVPAAKVAEVARACAARGVRALVVISAGFAESGEEGRARQEELLEICRDAGMRLIGPNCMGIINTHPEHPLNATFAPSRPPRGRIGFMSQSGALGLTVIEQARRLDLGLSTFVSVGNKADVSGNDLLEYWESDPETDLILLYLESFGNPRRFSRLARRIGRHKPILAVKSGRSAAGARATSSHTGALLAASDVTVEALFRQSGVIRADTLGELFQVATLLGSQPAPPGRRVGIVTNAGGLGILCADACADAGLEVPALSEPTRQRLGSFLPAEAATANPVDLIASARPEDYERTILTLAESGEVDALVAIFIPPLAGRDGRIAAAVRRAAGALGGRLPVLGVFNPEDASAAPNQGRVPVYTFPEDAARALGRVATWAEWRRRPEIPPFEPPDARTDEARAIVARALGEGAGWLRPEAVTAILDCYGIRLPETRLAASPEEAARAARALGGTVALKAFGPGIVHKTELGAVALSLSGPRAVRSAAERMLARLGAAGVAVEGFLVQRMLAPGVEMIVGVVQDPLFGPVLACGAGGTAVELLKDVSVRLTPLSPPEADEMLRSLKSFPLLEGHRGRPRADLDSLRELVLRVGALAEDLPELAELDLNPVIVGPSGAAAVDARIRVEPRTPPPPGGAKPRRRHVSPLWS
ncbi:MAG TPA: GNAT family N-acetyltransferase [Candidatus Dormibacteraeota bacterium]|nr:GNAT family N-acetyltransferase [Candidatus Dormibacteraeota bacterium]